MLPFAIFLFALLALDAGRVSGSATVDDPAPTPTPTTPLVDTFISTATVSSPAVLAPPSLTVTLPYATYAGVATGGVDKFLGMRFATAQRFGLPSLPPSAGGIQTVANYGPACPQPVMTIPIATGCPTSIAAAITAGLFGQTKPENPLEAQDPVNLISSEDCLNINVIRPSGIDPSVKLPVVFWIFGGAFEIGDTSLDEGSTVVNASINFKSPIIYVSANYRLSAFGFMGSQEILDAGVGNLGLHDQRFAMIWVQQNIALFGGNPDSVTVWGVSAGAMSIGLHLFIQQPNPLTLFRSAFMASGAPFVLKNMTAGQPIYDNLTKITHCDSQLDSLSCLKELPLPTFQAAINQLRSVTGFTSLNLPWQPYLDNNFLTQPVVGSSNYAKVPLIIGSCDDEGTIFSFSQLNLTTSSDAINYLRSNYVPSADSILFEPFNVLYSNDPTQGSPFGTGNMWNITPEYKRIAAAQGDLFFQAPRRDFLSMASKTQPTWGYIYKRKKDTPCIGSAHCIDLPEWYGVPGSSSLQGTAAVINFVTNGNPNVGMPLPIPGGWPQYDSTNPNESPQLLGFLNDTDLQVTFDDYRAEGVEFFVDLFPFYV